MCSTLRLNEKKKWYERGKTSTNSVSRSRIWRIKSRKIKTCDWMVCAMKEYKVIHAYTSCFRAVNHCNFWRGERKAREKEDQNSFPGKKQKRNVIFVICVIVIALFSFFSLRFDETREWTRATGTRGFFPGVKKKNNYLHVYMYIYINQNTIFVSVALWWIFW